MKLNPQGTQLAVTFEGDFTFELFDFDNSTGVISNGIILGPLSNWTYSCEFSKSGHYLYGCEDPGGTAYLYQFDVTLGTASAINASMVQVGAGSSNFNFGTLQNGPDGKIYVARFGENYLGVINDPESQGMACNYVDLAVSLSGKTNQYGLPNFITSYFYVPTGMAENDAPDDFLVYPNPFTSSIAISFHPGNPGENTNPTSLTIKNILGQTVFLKPTQAISNQLKPQIKLDLEFLPRGIYFLEILTDKERLVEKIVKQ